MEPLMEVKSHAVWLKVEIVKGRNVHKGKMRDLLKSPRPFVVLKVNSSHHEPKTSQGVNNDGGNPTWNEKFEFLLDESKTDHSLEVRLVALPHLPQADIGTEVIQLSPLSQYDAEEPTTVTVKYENGSEIEQQILESKYMSSNLMSSRSGRAGEILNFLEGLSLTPRKGSAQGGSPRRNDPTDVFRDIFEPLDAAADRLYIVDGGLAFNSPFPVVMPPRRHVDIYISFDFSMRDKDDSNPFEELKLAEKWARKHQLPFPPIDESVYDREGMQECYIFRDPSDPHCPVILHFVLVNIKFRDYLTPGVPRESEEDKSFADFSVFEDPAAPFSTFNFTYPTRAFDRLSGLMEFNTLLYCERVRELVGDVVRRNRANTHGTAGGK